MNAIEVMENMIEGLQKTIEAQSLVIENQNIAIVKLEQTNQYFFEELRDTKINKVEVDGESVFFHLTGLLKTRKLGIPVVGASLPMVAEAIGDAINALRRREEKK